MKELARILKALASERRLIIVRYLKTHQEAPVGELADNIHLSFRSTSKHLGVLASADLVEREQRSKQVYYRLAQDAKRLARTIINLI